MSHYPARLGEVDPIHIGFIHQTKESESSLIRFRLFDGNVIRLCQKIKVEVKLMSTMMMAVKIRRENLGF